MFIGSLMNEGTYCTHYYRVEPEYKQIIDIDTFEKNWREDNIYLKAGDKFEKSNVTMMYEIGMYDLPEFFRDIKNGKYYYRVNNDE
jgi:hypothetical protein